MMGLGRTFRDLRDDFDRADADQIREIVREVKPVLIGLLILMVAANLAVEAASLIQETTTGGLLLLVVSFVPIGIGVSILKRSLNW